MLLSTFDWIVVAGCLAASALPAVFYSRRASTGLSEFFASGRAVPWWLAGTSMVATTFSTDTPNLVTGLVRGTGVSANWSWWVFLLTGMLTVFFYARLWRRSGVLTDLEFYELRYSGRMASLVRGFRAIYLGAVFNCFIMATVTLAAVKIGNVMLGWSAWTTIIVCSVTCILFSSLAGLWGVLAGDLVQFVVAMAGVLAAAWYSLSHPKVGGLSGLLEKIEPGRLAMVPEMSDSGVMWSVLIMPLAVQWWASWYPGAEPGGGSYIAQRMLATKDERHAFGATLWFNIAHYALRPWPWIIVALCSLLVYPELSDIQAAFPQLDATLLNDDIAYPAMLALLPHGLLGLLLASLASAYVSTMSTHLNWGASYLVHDFYQRFVNPHGSQRHYVFASRLVTALLMVCSACLTLYIGSAQRGFELLVNIGLGTGLIYLLRWYWWRINAAGEFAAMIVALGMAIGLDQGWFGALESHDRLLLGAVVTTSAWVLVNLLTRPEPESVLEAFYRRIRPAGPGWRRQRAATGLSTPDHLSSSLWGFVLGCVTVYATLFCVGNVLYGRATPAFVCGTVALVGTAAMIFHLRRTRRGVVTA